MKFNLAILELQSIASHTPDSQVKINIARWIDKYIGECHLEITEYMPFNDEHAKYNIEVAMKKLGEGIAKESNMYPTYAEIENVRKARISSLYFKRSI